MQTFLPYPDIYKSVLVLDNKRLGKQRVEADQIIRINTMYLLYGPRKVPWENHPAAKMWRESHEVLNTLILYYNFCLLEWQNRGFKNIKLAKRLCGVYKYPSWWGGPIHASHRSNLMAKDPKWYKQYFSDLPGQPYVWPVP